MRYRLELLKPQTEKTKFGSTKTDYAVERTVWAERVRMSGSASLEVGEMFSAYNTVFNIRDVHPVAEKWRVHPLGEDNVYTVNNIIPYKDRGFNQLVCERVNE